MHKLTKDYIVGLVDGEGSFTVYVRNPKSPTGDRKRRVRAEPRFYLKLVEQDRSILEALKDYFKCGSVYFQRDNRENHQHCYRFEVSNRADLIKVIIPFFKKNILKFPSKKRDFDLFCEMMERIEKGEHLDSKGLNNLFELKKKMHSSSRSAGNPLAASSAIVTDGGAKT